MLAELTARAPTRSSGCYLCELRQMAGKGISATCARDGHRVRSDDHACESPVYGQRKAAWLARERERHRRNRLPDLPSNAPPELLELRRQIALAQLSLRQARFKHDAEATARWRTTLDTLIRQRDDFGLSKMMAKPQPSAVPERCDHCGSTMIFRDPDGFACVCGRHWWGASASERLYGERPIGDALPSLSGVLSRIV